MISSGWESQDTQQAIPLSGSYWGDADDELGMEVTVNVKTEGGSTSLSPAAAG